jgi:hypothetical protein
MKEFSQKSPAITEIARKSEREVEERKMAETTMKSDDFTRGADQAKPVTVRFAPEIAVRLDADAQTRGASPTEIVRAIVCEHYSGAGEPAALIREIRELIEDRFRHIVYEISRTRSSLYNIVEQSESFRLDRPKLKEIQQWSREDASEYLGRLDAEIDRRKGAAKTNGEARRG